MLALSLLGAFGCPTRDKYDRMPAVRITSPVAATTYTNGTVRLTAAIDPGLDLPINLVENGAVLWTLTPPSYSYDWATAGVPEGTHTITAEVEFSDGNTRSSPVTIVVDRTPPTVARFPAPGARNVALRAPIRAVFSEPIVASRPSSAFSLSFLGGPSVETRASLDPDGTTATIAIDDVGGVQLPTSFVGVIDPEITDRAGNRLLLPSGDWIWDVPDFIKAPPIPLCSSLPVANALPAVALGADARPVVAWAAAVTRSDGVHCALTVSRYEDDGFTALAPVSDDVNSGMRGAAIVTGPGGDPIIAWRPGSLPDPGEIDVAALNETTWQGLPAIVPGPGVSFPIVYPVLRIDPAARPVLLWGAGVSADRYFMARWTEAGWQEEFGVLPIISALPFDRPRFDFILHANGNPIVSWINPLNRGHVSRWDGATWVATPEIVDMTEPYLAVDATGAPMIVSGGGGSFFVQHLTSANLWQPQPAIGTPPQARHPRLAAGPDGLPVLGWYDAQTKSVGMGRWLGARWDVRAYAFSPTNALDEAPAMAVDRDGTAWVGWRDTAGTFNLWMSNY